MHRYRHFLFLVLLISCCPYASAGMQTPSQPGALVATVIPPEASVPFGKAIGYDGHYLYYAEWSGPLLHRIDLPPKGVSNATGHVTMIIVGAPTGIMSISYDSTRDAFWAVGGDGLTIYLMDKTGNAKLQFVINVLSDLPGLCKPHGNLWLPGCRTEVKINYDGTDDTIWYAPDTSKRIYHYKTQPDQFGTAQLVESTPFVDVDVAPNDMSAECGYSQVNGVAVGGSSLFFNVAGCTKFFEFTKTGIKLGSYPIQPSPTGDIECDNRTYDVSIFWARSGSDGLIYGYEQPRAQACLFGGGLWP